jgi:hypothetical protein
MLQALKRHRVLSTALVAVVMACLLGALLLATTSRPARATAMYDQEWKRFGYGVANSFGPISNYPLSVVALNAGWYTDYWVSANPPRPNGIEYIQTLYLQGMPSAAQITSIATAQPGNIWVIGNEIDRQDETAPWVYVQIYHDTRAIIKAADPTARIANGSIVQATPLRMRYIDDMFNEYEARYGEPMPVDIWNIHEQILREDYSSYGCKVPVIPITYTYSGISTTGTFPLYCRNDGTGEVEYCTYDDAAQVAPGQTRIDSNTDYDGSPLYSVQDNANSDLFIEHIYRFRQWMKDNDQQDKPLMISEMGVLYPSDYWATGELAVAQYMTDTFEFMLSATDEAIGCPGDGNRLVQQWNWFTLNRPILPYPDISYNGSLVVHDGDELTLFGEIFANFTNNGSPEIVSASQSASTVAPGVTHIIAATYSDPDGYDGLEETYIQLDEGTGGLAAADLKADIGERQVLVKYVLAENKLYLRNSADTGWLGGLTPGAAGNASNGEATLLGAQCTVEGAGNLITTTLAFSYKETLLGGLYAIKVHAKDDIGHVTPWETMDTLFIGTNDYGPVSVQADGIWGKPGDTHVFTATYRHQDGVQLVRYVDFMLNDDATPVKCVAVRYDAVNNLVFLHHATNPSVWNPAGGVPLSDGGTLSTNFGILDIGASSVSTTSTTITVRWALTPSHRLSGQSHDLWMDITNTAGESDGWVDHGDYVVNRTPNYLRPPTALSPFKSTANAGAKIWFDPAYQDLDKQYTLDKLYFAIADTLPAADAPNAASDGIFFRYDHEWDATNTECIGQFYFWKDGAWIGPYDGFQDVTVEADHARVIMNWTRAIFSDFRNVKVFWRMIVEPDYLGQHYVYMRAIDTMGSDAGGDTGWKKKGYVIIE